MRSEPDKLPAAPGRPRSFERDTVLRTALEMFWRDGFRDTTTRDLEQGLGLSQSSIYNTFGSKEDLLRAAVTEYESLTEARLVLPLEQSDQGLRAVDRFFVDLVAWITDQDRQGCLLINLMAEDGGRSEHIRARTTAYRDRVRSALGAALQRAHRAGELEGAYIEHKAEMLVGLALGLCIAARGGVDSDELDGLLAATRTQIRSWAQP